MHAQTAYEKQLGYNAVTRWLHSFRYRDTVQVLRSMDMDRPIKVLEIGAAEGKLFDVISDALPIEYTGIEIREDFVRTACSRHDSRRNFRMINRSALDLSGLQADVVITLETLEHIPEHDVVRIIEAIAEMRPRCFICSVPVEIGPAVWCKNVGSLLAGYNRHLEYTWRETLWAGLYQLDRIRTHKTGHIGFDWRWLAQTLRHNMHIREMRRFPFRFLPAALCTTVFFVCEPH